MDLFEVGFAKEFVFHNFSFRFHGSFTDLLLFNASSVPNRQKEKISDKIPAQKGENKIREIPSPFLQECKIALSPFPFSEKKIRQNRKPLLNLEKRR